MMTRHSALAFGMGTLLLFGLAHCATPADDEASEEGSSALLGTIKLAPVADAEVAEATPSTNLGASMLLGSDGSPNRRSFLRFAVTGVTGTVKSAKLRCYTTNGSTNGPSLYRTSGAWDEKTVTWSTKPGTTGAAFGDLGAVAANTWIEFDVTSAVTGNGTYDFALVPTSTDSVECASREAANNKPELVLSVDTPTPVAGLACPSGFGTEVFRDDFDGSAVDTTKWDVVNQNNGGSGNFTQLTKMRTENVSVANGRLHVASKRHCQDPWTNKSAPENPAKCAGTNYYSGGWLKTKNTYAPTKGLMMFLAKMPTPVQGIFPALWARNARGDALYMELDLIETWWDMAGVGKASDPNKFQITSHFGTGAAVHTPGLQFGPVANLTTAFHVWEVEWDANASPPQARYYYRDAPGATRSLVQTVTASSNGFAGKINATDFQNAIKEGWRAYVDFAVSAPTTWHVGPDAAPTYDPPDLEVESVVICKP